MRKGLMIAAVLLLTGSPAFPKTLVVNANGYTIGTDGAVERFAGFVVGDDGRVERVLAKGEAEPRGAEFTARLDAGGRTLLPGLIDAHGHVIEMGLRAGRVDLAGTRSLGEALERVRAYAAANPTARWILGGGWNQVSWGMSRMPTAAELDRAVPDRPVWLARIDVHASWANSAAIKAAGVTARTKDPAGGRIERLPGGAPAGVFVDAAQDLVAKVVPPPSAAEREAALERALTIMASVGLTGVHDAGIEPADWTLYRTFGDEGRLTARIYAMARGLEAVEAISPLRPTPWLYGDRLALKAVKLFADGALGSHGAWLKAPYADEPANRGLQFQQGVRLKNLASRANFLGYQVAIHAIGDAANAQALDAYAEMLPTYGPKFRNRIEHAQVLDPADIPRFRALGVIASMQPTHATSDKDMAGIRLGEARLAGAYAWKTLLDSGARLAFGSDFPVESPNPFLGLHAAVTRQDVNDQPPGGWRVGEAVTRAQALAGFTTWAAYASGMEERLGRIAPGYWADFILVDRDPMTAPASEIKDVRVEETWLAGRRVWVRPSR